MDRNNLRTDLYLIITAIIWGFAFVAQRIGMDHVGPYTFNAVRFLLSGLFLIPFIYYRNKNGRSPKKTDKLLIAALLAGTVLFMGAAFQQVGLVYTTAGKAGFITGLYVVLVPIIGLFWQQRPGTGTWVGACLAAAGLYFLCVTEAFTIEYGDFLELVGAFFWATHVLIIAKFSPRNDPIKLACLQFFVCSIISFLAAVSVETITIAGLSQAAIPILYGGFLSGGIAYTLQVVAQQNAHPAHAAIILSLEVVFAAIGGWLILGETLTIRGLLGCALMLSGMLVSNLWRYIQIGLWKASRSAS